MASTYLTRTPTINGNQKTWTWSSWIKLSKVNTSDYQMLFQCYYGNQTRYSYISYTNSKIETYGGFYTTGASSTESFDVTTTRLLRDTSAWYHLVVVHDSTESTDTDRLKIYINGERETSFTSYDNLSPTFPSLNSDTFMNVTTTENKIGRGNPGQEFNGLMSHIHFIDGTAYDATAFGEYDANGVWKIKTSPSVTYGTNGFFILKDGNSVTDQSPNTNNFTVGGGTLTNTEDCPSNVFPTINPLTYSTTKWNLEYGNLRTNGLASGESAAWRSVYGTLGASSGKYYFEMKVTRTYSVDSNNIIIGIVDAEQMKYEGDNGKFFGTSRGYGYHAKDGKKLNNDSVTANGVNYGNSWTTNDIIGCAFDLDNHKLYFSKNGSWQNSGDPTSGATGTGSAFDLATGYTYLPTVSHFYDDDRIEFNFGNGYFGTTAVASAGTNASGNGIFEFDCPNGYTALSTKGLNL